jgi:hypothetical protein
MTREKLKAYAEMHGSVPVSEDLAARERVLSPDDYEIVEVRTSQGLKRPLMLIRKTALKAIWAAEAPFYKTLGLVGDSVVS